jgi:hypothetical protein
MASSSTSGNNIQDVAGILQCRAVQQDSPSKWEVMGDWGDANLFIGYRSAPFASPGKCESSKLKDITCEMYKTIKGGPIKELHCKPADQPPSVPAPDIAPLFPDFHRVICRDYIRAAADSTTEQSPVLEISKKLSGVLQADSLTEGRGVDAVLDTARHHGIGIVARELMMKCSSSRLATISPAKTCPRPSFPAKMRRSCYRLQLIKICPWSSLSMMTSLRSIWPFAANYSRQTASEYSLSNKRG